MGFLELASQYYEIQSYGQTMVSNKTNVIYYLLTQRVINNVVWWSGIPCNTFSVGSSGLWTLTNMRMKAQILDIFSHVTIFVFCVCAFLWNRRFYETFTAVGVLMMTWKSPFRLGSFHLRLWTSLSLRVFGQVFSSLGLYLEIHRYHTCS